MPEGNRLTGNHARMVALIPARLINLLAWYNRLGLSLFWLKLGRYQGMVSTVERV